MPCFAEQITVTELLPDAACGVCRRISCMRMLTRRKDELQQFLAWRRQTRFIRHYGGPILAVTLFAACIWYVWQAAERLPRPNPQERKLSKHLWQDIPAKSRQTSKLP